MAAALRELTLKNDNNSKTEEIFTDDGLKLQFLHEHGPGGETIVGESSLVGCYYDGIEVLKNRYDDYKYWNTRTEFETRRREANNKGLKGLAPLRRVATAKWSSDSLRQF